MAVINGTNWRAIISPAVAITFMSVAGTGVLMLCDLKGGNLRGLHEIAGLVFAAAGLIHLIVNWRPLRACFRRPVALVFFGVATAICVLALVTPGREHNRGRHHGEPPRDGRIAEDARR